MSSYPPPTPDPLTGGQEPGPMPPIPAPPGTAQGGALSYTLVDKDANDLRTLSICWYVLAGLQALASCLFLLYIAFGVFMMLIGGAAGAGTREPGAAVPFLGFGAFMLCVGLVPLAIVLTVAYLNYTVARSLPLRKNLTLCYIMSAIVCLGIPLGTILGIFTFVVLNRPSVKASFQ
jgi:hypothetical protein